MSGHDNRYMYELGTIVLASKLSGDSTYYNVAVKYADTTMKNHFRANNYWYHVVDHDPVTGEVRCFKCTGQTADVCWAADRHGLFTDYTMCYRYTHDQK